MQVEEIFIWGKRKKKKEKVRKSSSVANQNAGFALVTSWVILNYVKYNPTSRTEKVIIKILNRVSSNLIGRAVPYMTL